MPDQTLTLPNMSEGKPSRMLTLAGALICAALLYAATGFGIKIVPAFLVGCLVVWAVFADPFYGLLLVFFMIFSGAAAGFELPGGYMAVAAFASLAWMFDRIRKFDLTLQYPGQQTLFIALLFAAFFLSVPFSFNQKASILQIIGYLKVLVLYLLIVNVLRTEKQFNLALTLIYATLVISFVYGVYNLLFAVKELQAVGVAGKTMERIQGLTHDPNIYASSLLIFLPLPFLYVFEEKRFLRKCLWATLFAVLAASVAITFSRGGLLSFAVVMAILMFKKRHNRFVLWSGIVAIFVIIILLPPEFWQRFSFLSNLRGEASARWRFNLAAGALSYFRQHPIFGIGLGSYIGESIRFIPRHLVAHNIYVEIAAETGIVGLLAFLSLVWTTMRYYERSRLIFEEHARPRMALSIEALKIGFYGFLFSALFLSLQQDVLLWVQLGIAGALRLMADRLAKI